MKAIKSSRNLYHTHAHVLAPLGYPSLPDIAQQSFDTFRQTCRQHLNLSETQKIYQIAQRQKQQLKAYQRKVISHANPQLSNTLRLAHNPMRQENRDYETLFSQRADEYVPKNSVASMFSPAAYLTELYREGRQLHNREQLQHLDNRRPDLQNLSLSQSNMDTEISTLALSNDILRASINESELDTVLASQLYPFDLPYHAPFSSIETTLKLQDSSFEAVAACLAPTMPDNSVSVNTLSAFANHLSPVLVEALLAQIPTDNGSLNNQLKLHFGSDATVTSLSQVEVFCQKTGISHDELNRYMALPSFRQSYNVQNHSSSVQAKDNIHQNLLTSPSQYGGSYLNLTIDEWVGYANNSLSRVSIEAEKSVTDRLNILPSMNDNCIVFNAFSVTEDGVPSTFVDIMIDGKHITGDQADTFDDDQGIQSLPLIKGVRQVEFRADKEEHKLCIGVGDSNIYSPGGWYPAKLPASNNFTVKFTPLGAADLIKLSKVIRYCKKTGLTPATLNTLIKLSQGETAQASINSQTLQLTARVLAYMSRYGVSEDDAVVLVGGEINVYAKTDEHNQFDALFNHPPLQGQNFTLSGQLIFTPDEVEHKFHRAVLKRAFNMDDAELQRAAMLVDSDDYVNISNNITNLTDLYFVALLTRVFDITTLELDSLWRCLSLREVYRATPDQMAVMVTKLAQTIGWLRAQNLSVSALQAMIGKGYPTLLIPEMENLINSLYQSITDYNCDSTSLKQHFAPHLAGDLKLSSTELAIVLQDWMDLIANEQGLTLTSIEQFWQEIIKFCDNEPNTEADTAALATFCQALGQLALIVKTWTLSAPELALLVYKPYMLPVEQFYLSLTQGNLQRMSRFKTLQTGVGESASELLSALTQNLLNISQLAGLFNKPESELLLAAAAIDSSVNSLDILQAANISVWLKTAEQLGISTGIADTLLSIEFEDGYSSWETLAGDIISGLPADLHTTITRSQDEALSTALCAYFLAEYGSVLSNAGVKLDKRDDIFQYLLIDNQVSADIMTRYLAEAISSVQLYIHRCLQGLEVNVERSQLLEHFFVEWDQYNKRYSSWAGVSQLAYYPENYLDPTLRYNQTGLQQQLLSEISQSQLSKDSVEAAYLNYLDGFEDIANLKIVSGYHHGAELDKGISYFIGRTNAQPYRYFWRSLDVEASDGQGGYVASAWSEWEEMNTPVYPVRDQVRPVIYNDRLYIAWVELRSQPQTSEEGLVVDTIDEYSLQLSYRKINGSWNPAMSFALSIPSGLIDPSGPIFDLYFSYHPLQNAILALLYDPTQENDGGDYDSVDGLGEWVGGYIDNRMQYHPIVDGEDEGEDTNDEAVAIFSLFYNNLNGPSTPNKVIRYINVNAFDVNCTPAEPVENVVVENSAITVNSAFIDAAVDPYKLPQELSYRPVGEITLDQPAPSAPTGTILPDSDPIDTAGDMFDVSVPVAVEGNIEGDKFVCTLTPAITPKANLVIFKAANKPEEPIWFDTKTDANIISSGSANVDGDGASPKIKMNCKMSDAPDWSSARIQFSVFRTLDINDCWPDGETPNPSTYIGTYNPAPEPDAFSFTKYALEFVDESPVLEMDETTDFDKPLNGYHYAIFCFGTDTDDMQTPDHTVIRDIKTCHVYDEVTAISEKITIKFAGDTEVIERLESTPAEAITRTLTYKQSVSNETVSETFSLNITDESGGSWTQKFKVSNTGSKALDQYSYQWEDGNNSTEIAIPQGTQNINRGISLIDLPPNDPITKVVSLVIKKNGTEIYRQTFTLNTFQTAGNYINPADFAQIVQDDNQAIYLDLESTKQPTRTRLNTLFANELIKRASSGLDNVLSWETQQLPEPQLGEGTYVELVLDVYDAEIHGPKMDVTIEYIKLWENSDHFPIYSGTLNKQHKTTIKLFLGYYDSSFGNQNRAYIRAIYSSGTTDDIRFVRDDISDPHGWELESTYHEGTFDGLSSARALQDTTEPMDFSGANGLYFWELFYYTPMLVVERLLDAQSFEEAEKWLKYVFNPQGYLTGEGITASPVDRYWNVRPLEEDTAWDETQTDSTDPDIVAQGDPMHYKVATYMKLQDLLIARGDMAYRQLEKDSLAEAKMWYVTALNMLGEEPDLPLASNWSEPTLGTAASQVLQNQNLYVLEQLTGGSAPVQERISAPQDTSQARTANSLTALFLPSENEKLKGYWQTLNQRLFNLRHNLSIDGQPLTLPIYAAPADPKALQSAAAVDSAGGLSLPKISIALQRFPLMLESARGLIAQLVQYGGNLTSVLERKDVEALNVLLQTQAQDLMISSIKLQENTLEQLQAEQHALEASLAGAQAHRDSYQALLDEGISNLEQQAMDDYVASGSMSTASNAFRVAGAAIDATPNVFGMAVGGMQIGSLSHATAYGIDAGAVDLTTKANAKVTSEQYRRRAQEWTIQRDGALHEIKQIEAQQASLTIQCQAAQLQKSYLETQQSQAQTQLDFMKTKFSNEQLYSWMQGRLAALFYQFYDLAVSRCLKAQLAYQWETRDAATFIQPGAWDSNHAGLLCGEALALNLAQMESAYVDWDARALEVKRTVSMAQEMELQGSSFNDKVIEVIQGASESRQLAVEESKHQLTLSGKDGEASFVASIDLGALDILSDYPGSVVGEGKVRRIKQVSVSLPALLGPYQDIQAVLGYSGSGDGIHQSCTQTAISHGMNDSGQFQLDFNEGKYLPFEGLPIDGGNSASLTLTFPNVAADKKQHDLVQTLSDIILHISYTIRT
ncbi:neuraminidase-like domain-containing protein [Shewanella sp. YLB-07]|uniref:Tc toxin subunit A-related protein n=1 Tax=Shewanella sp. YLB-07 TaxID=2601268 RepID=UPI00128DDF15|nr:neuraminidase-like domain-containing protein [Shewanella sp. YLB-07]MPY24336.1 hypothetical protein [Shewanella sp. YLB-07]